MDSGQLILPLTVFAVVVMAVTGMIYTRGGNQAASFAGFLLAFSLLGLAIWINNGAGITWDKKVVLPVDVESLRAAPFEIDVVYTWAGEGKEGMRMENRGELKASLRSVWQFLPWVNRIYIVMNSPKQTPSWFDEETYGRYITILDHDDIFTDGIETKTPVTNSNSIETALTNIPGLSEHFLYFNDDFFIARPLEFTEFFTANGKAVVQPSYALQNTSDSTFPGPLPKIAAGFHTHSPYPMRRSSFIDFKNQFHDYIAWIRSYNSRQVFGCSMCDSVRLSCPCQHLHGTFANYMLERGEAVGRDEYLYDDGNPILRYIDHRNISNLKHVKLENLGDTFAINDTSPTGREKLKKYIREWLEREFPTKAPFEKLF